MKLFTSLFFLVSTLMLSAHLIGAVPPCDHLPTIEQKTRDPASGALTEAAIAIDTSFTIEATWIGDPQWMSGVNNGYETFNGSIARGHNFFGSNLLASQFSPVEIRFNSDSSKWSNVQVFKRSGFTSVGVGKFPGSAWDMSDKTNPRRLNLLILECYTCDEPISGPPNLRWDPDNSANGKYEFLFVMLSSYDSTGLMYAGTNILTVDLDNLYAWWPRVAAGHTFFETDSAVLKITPRIGLETYAFDNSIDLSWVNPGSDPDHFRIYYSIDSMADNFLAEVSGDSRAYTHGGLTVGQAFFYQIKSFDADNNEIYDSPIKRAKTRETTISISFSGQWNQRTDYGGIWGYTDSGTGLEYALLCSRSQGLSIIDINNSTPVEVGFVPGSADLKEVRTYSHYAIANSEGAPTKIINLSNVSNPVVISTIPNGQHTLQISGHYVFLAGGGGAQGLEIFSITDPANPVFVSEYDPYYYHDFAIRNDTLAAFAIGGQGIDILDITNIVSPALISHFNYPSSGPHNGVFSNDGNYLFVGDEIGRGNWTRVFDVSDLNNVSHVSDLIVDPNAVVHNCEIKGDHLYIAHYIHGLRVWNVADPLEPYEVTSYDTHPQPNAGYNGAWGVYPHFASGKIIVSDMQNGLFVFNSTLLGSSCCIGSRGDFNGDNGASANILDLNYLVNDIFRSGPDSPCSAEADVNGDGRASTILDLNYLVNDIFRSGPDMPVCP